MNATLPGQLAYDHRLPPEGMWDDWEPTAAQIESEAVRMLKHSREEVLEFVSCDFTADSEPICSTPFSGWISPEQMVIECLHPDASAEKCKEFFVQMFEALKQRFDSDLLDAALVQAKEDAAEADFERRFGA